MKQENNEKKEIEFGTLYDINKNIVKQNEIKLSEGVKNSKKQIITDFIKKCNNYYYMLLCNERKDYTVFRWVNISNNDDAKEIAQILQKREGTICSKISRAKVKIKEKYNLRYYETSAKDGTNVQNIFEYLAKIVLKSRGFLENVNIDEINVEEITW